MGAERVIDDAAEFARKDPKFFNFLWVFPTMPNEPTFKISMRAIEFIITADMKKPDGEEFSCDDPLGQKFVRQIFDMTTIYRFNDEQVLLDFVEGLPNVDGIESASWVSGKPIMPPIESVEGRIY